MPNPLASKISKLKRKDIDLWGDIEMPNPPSMNEKLTAALKLCLDALSNYYPPSKSMAKRAILTARKALKENV